MTAGWIVSVAPEDDDALVRAVAETFATFTEEYGFRGDLVADDDRLEMLGYGRFVSRPRQPGLRPSLLGALCAAGSALRADTPFVFVYGGRTAPDGALRDECTALDPEQAGWVSRAELLHRLYSLPARQMLVVVDTGTGPAWDPVPDGDRPRGRPGRAVVLTSAGRPVLRALNDYCRDDVPLGGVLDPAALAARCGTDGVCHPSLGMLRSRNEELDIRRPGLSLVGPRVVWGAAGELVPIAVDTRNGAPADAWSLRCLEYREDTQIWHDVPALGRWHVRSTRPGSAYLTVVARRADAEARHDVHFVVGAGPGDTVALAPPPEASVWEVGVTDAVAVGTLVGDPPFELVPHTAAGFPDGLRPQVDVRSGEVRVVGEVRAVPPAHRLPLSRACVLWNGAFTARDGRGRHGRLRVPLRLLPAQAYVTLESAACRVGLDARGKEAALKALMDEFLRQHVEVTAADRRMKERIEHELAAGQQQTVAYELLSSNPGSTVAIPRFAIKRYPVTNLEWRDFVAAHDGGYVPRDWGDPPDYFEDTEGTLPVVNVSHDDIRAYLAWKGTRLPTWQEWELAARGSDGRLFPWGDAFDARCCNVLESGRGTLVPVEAYQGTFRNPHAAQGGVWDMVGNAAEWVERRVCVGTAPLTFAQPFRGGSFLDPCTYALACRDSREAGVLFRDERQPIQGETRFRWLGFRDVVDLGAAAGQAQALLEIPETVVYAGGATRRVPAFRMARYLVSNEEYLAFVTATGWRRPTDWAAAPKLPFPAYAAALPVVGVSHHDAMAFCLWKSRATGRVIRLPRELEWRASVHGSARRAFPWGEQYDPQRCNGCFSGWGGRLPVHAQPEGCSEAGVYQLIGNVCEWDEERDALGGSWEDDCAECAVPEGRRWKVGVRSESHHVVGFRYVERFPRRG